MATETNTTDTIFDVTNLTGNWASATKQSSAHEHMNYKATFIAGGIANGDSANHVLTMNSCIPKVLTAYKDGELSVVDLEFDCLGTVSRTGVFSSIVKTLRHGVFYLEDGGGGPLRFTIDYEQGNFNFNKPNDALVVVRDRGAIVASAKGEEQVGSISVSLWFRAFAKA